METWWQAAALDLSAEPSVPVPITAAFHQATPMAPSTSACHSREGSDGPFCSLKGCAVGAGLIIQLVGFLAPVLGGIQ